MSIKPNRAAYTQVLLALTFLIVVGGLARATQIQRDIQVTGTWDGTFSGTVEGTGTSQDDTFVMELKQQGTMVTGILRFKGLDTEFPVSGKVAGTTFTYTSKARLSSDCEASITAETMLDESSGKLNGSQTQKNCEGAAAGQVTAVRRNATASQELDPAATRRIEQAGASIVTVKLLDQQNETVSQAKGFLIRKDLIATDLEIDRNSSLQVTVATKGGAVKVIRAGNYFLPYVLIETQAEISPLSLGDSERVVLNDPVYMLSDSGKIVSGRITGITTIKNTRAFSINIPVDANNKGAPVFDRYGGVIGIATKTPDVPSGSLAWASDVLATLKHLGEPGVGVGSGDGPQFGVRPAPDNSDTSSVSTVDTKPVALSKPTPRYTAAARANGTQGSVLLRVLVGADGSVKSVRVVRGLPDGLTEEAVTEAREIKFKPATKDGKPVPYLVGLEINFTIR